MQRRLMSIEGEKVNGTMMERAMRCLSLPLSIFDVITVGERCLRGMVDPAVKGYVDYPQCGVKVP